MKAVFELALGSLILQSKGVKVKTLEEYLEHHNKRIGSDFCLFHLHYWLRARNVSSTLKNNEPWTKPLRKLSVWFFIWFYFKTIDTEHVHIFWEQ